MVRSALSEAAVCLSPRVLGWDSGCPVARSWGTTGLHAQPVRPHSPEANGGEGKPQVRGEALQGLCTAAPAGAAPWATLHTRLAYLKDGV